MEGSSINDVDIERNLWVLISNGVWGLVPKNQYCSIGYGNNQVGLQEFSDPLYENWYGKILDLSKYSFAALQAHRLPPIT